MTQTMGFELLCPGFLGCKWTYEAPTPRLRIPTSPAP